jgi:anti-sigma B factor antagonist
LVVSGEVDMSSAAEFRDAGIAAVSAPGIHELLIDLAAVTFMDSSGIGALVAIRTAGNELFRAVTIVDVSPQVYQVIEVCGLAAVFGLAQPDSLSAAD